jgi:hypothetical protein
MSLPYEIIEINMINYVWPGEFWKLPLVWRGVNIYNIFLGFWEQNTYIYQWSTVIHINIDDRVAYLNADFFCNSQPYSLSNKNSLNFWWGEEDDINYLALWYYFSKSYYGFIDVTYIEGGMGPHGFHHYWIVTDTS